MSFNLKKTKTADYSFQPYDMAKLQNWILQNLTGIESQTPEEALQSLNELQPQINQMGFTVQQVKDMIPNLMDTTKTKMNLQDQLPVQGVEEGQSTILSPVAKTNNNVKKGETQVKPFNLKVAGLPQAAPMQGSPDNFDENIENTGDMLESQQRKFSNGADVQKWLTDEVDITRALDLIAMHDDGETGKADMVQSLIKDFYSYLNEPVKDDRELEKRAGQIYDNMPETLKNEGVIPAVYQKFEMADDIKKIAQEHVRKMKAKSFNLNKTAQHKALNNAIMWGPAETRKVDPFLHQPVSDWHIIERNKGFGLVVDDVWNIDYETIWRQNIMDKYSRPYRDKDGNWVGGYIQKRFEVDKNIPVSNNMQLKPGQKRKPILPEYGTIESRLQEARASGDVEGAIDKSKPFNWKKAQTIFNPQKRIIVDESKKKTMCDQCWIEHGQYGRQCFNDCGCHEAYENSIQDGLIQSSAQDKKKS